MLLLVLVALMLMALACCPKKCHRSSAERAVEHICGQLRSSAKLGELLGEVQRTWQIKPSGTQSRTSFDERTIWLIVLRPNGQRYDDITLLCVLLHELAHVVTERSARHSLL